MILGDDEATSLLADGDEGSETATPSPIEIDIWAEEGERLRSRKASSRSNPSRYSPAAQVERRHPTGNSKTRKQSRKPPPPSPVTSTRNWPTSRMRSKRARRRRRWQSRPASDFPDPDGQREGATVRNGFRTGRLRSSCLTAARRTAARPVRSEGTGPQAGRDPGPLRGRGDDHRRRHRPARFPLRASARARHEGEEGHRALQRPRLRARLDRDPHPRADSGQAGSRGRGPELGRNMVRLGDIYNRTDPRRHR